MAAAATIPNNIVDTTVNDAARPMANWNAILTWINANAVHLDGAKAMTGTLSGPAGVDPVSANEYARKAYVDAKSAADVAAEAVIRAAADLAPAKFGASVAVSPGISVPTGVATSITFNVENYDTSAFFTGPTTNVQIPAASGGLYLMTFTTFASAAPTAHNTTAFLNGTPLANGVSTANTSGSSIDICTITILRQMAALDVLVLQVKHSAGISQTIFGTITIHRLAV